MSAGPGIRHSEFNASTTDPVHMLQIWIKPDKNGVVPGYEQQALPPIDGTTRLDLVASPEGGPIAVWLHADTRLTRAALKAGGTLEISLAQDRHLWVQPVRGNAVVAGQAMSAGDGLAVSNVGAVHLTSDDSAELLVFDLA